MKKQTIIIIIIIFSINYFQNKVISSKINIDFDKIYQTEEKQLNINFIGLREQYIDQNYLIEYLDRTFTSTYPKGDILSILRVKPNIHYVDDEISTNFYNYILNASIKQNESYYCNYKDFIINIEKINKDHEIEDSSQLFIYIISFENKSTLDNYNVYINYTQYDIDTKKVSSITEYSTYGITFSSSNNPILGLITSSIPKFEIIDYPIIYNLINNLETQHIYTTKLAKTIEDVIWSQINPSPIFRYGVHKNINLHLSFLTMNISHRTCEPVSKINLSLIQKEIGILLNNSNINIICKIKNANEMIQNQIVNIESDNSISRWLEKMEIILKNENNSGELWDTIYNVKHGNYNIDLDLFTIIILGSDEYLQYKEDLGGYTYYSDPNSEYAGLAIITSNINNIIEKNEGISRTLIHEIGHLFGLIHPHDYWNPELRMFKYSWCWGYINTPMTYLITSYEWGFFDKYLINRIQVDSLLNQIYSLDADNKVIDIYLNKIKSGDFESLDLIVKDLINELEKLINNNKIMLHNIPWALGLIPIIIILYNYKKTKN